MAKLFNRQFAVNVGGVAIASAVSDRDRIHATLRLAFRIERTTAKDPNPAELTLYNLSKDTRSYLSEDSTQKLKATVEVGYSGLTFQIYSGDVQNVVSQRSGTDWVTKLQLKDGGREYRSARINESMGPGTSIQDAIQKAAQATGLPLGNLLQKIAGGSIRGSTAAFSKGVVLSGKAEEQFDKLMKVAGFEWSIQDGQLQALAPSEPLPVEAVVLNSGSGLIGSPERGEKGLVKARSLIQPGLLPGRSVLIDGEAIAGTFRIERVLYTGDSWGKDWYADLETKPLRTG